MIWTGRCSSRVKVSRTQGSSDALQAPQILLVTCLSTIEEIRQWDVEMCGESRPVCAAVVCGARTGDDIPQDLLLVVVPLDLGMVLAGTVLGCAVVANLWWIQPSLVGSVERHPDNHSHIQRSHERKIPKTDSCLFAG